MQTEEKPAIRYDPEPLRARMKRLGLRQNTAAQALGITPVTFSRKMNAQSQFRPSELAALAGLLGLPVQGLAELFFTTKVQKN